MIVSKLTTEYQADPIGIDNPQPRFSWRLLGDHMEPRKDHTSSFAPTRTPADLIGTAYLSRCATVLADAASLLGKDEDATEYAAIAENVKKAFNSVEKFFYRDVAGIEPVAPGYRRIALAPKLTDKLDSSKASIDTARGRVAVAWTKTDAGLTMHVAVPPNTTAAVSVPVGDGSATIMEGKQAVWQKGAFVEGVAGVTAGRANDGVVTFEIGSGDYTFTA